MDLHILHTLLFHLDVCILGGNTTPASLPRNLSCIFLILQSTSFKEKKGKIIEVLSLDRDYSFDCRYQEISKAYIDKFLTISATGYSFHPFGGITFFPVHVNDDVLSDSLHQSSLVQFFLFHKSIYIKLIYCMSICRCCFLSYR